MNLLTAVIVFLSYYLLDVIYVVFVRNVGLGNAVTAANCSVIIYLLAAIGITNYVENPLYLIPMCLGAWVGTWSASHYGNEHP